MLQIIGSPYEGPISRQEKGSLPSVTVVVDDFVALRLDAEIRPSDVDLFAILTGDGDLYLIPIEAVAGYTAIYLSAYADYRVGSVASLLN